MKDQYFQLLERLPGNVVMVQLNNDEIIIKACNHGFEQLICNSGPEKVQLEKTRLSVSPSAKQKLIEKMTDLLNLNEREDTYIDAELIYPTVTSINVRCSFTIYEHSKQLFLILLQELTDLNNLEEELVFCRETRQMVHDLVDNYIFSYSISTQEFTVNERYRQLRGIDLTKGDAMTADVFVGGIHPNDQNDFMKAFNASKEEEQEGIVEVRVRISQEHLEPIYEWTRIYYKSIAGMNGKISRILFRATSIEFLKRDEKRGISELDELTRLPNRISTTNAIHDYLKTSKGMEALILIDFDNFGKINDVFGRAYGDQVIQTQSSKIRKLFRSTDIVGRYSGDQILILMKSVNKVLVHAVMDSLCNSARLMIRTDDEEVELTASLGVAFYPEDGKNFEQVFARVEMAMVRAKSEGKNRYCLADHGLPNLSKLQEFITTKDQVQVVSKRTDRDFVSYCFEMLTNSPDVENAINLAIAAIGEHYDLEAVGIFLFDRKENQAIRTNRWVTIEGIWESPYMLFNRGTLHDFEKLFDEQGILAYNNVQNAVVSEFHDNYYPEHEIKATLYCKFLHSEIVQGCVGFQNITGSHIWTENEKKTFIELTNILGVFIGLRKQKEDDKRIIKQLQRRDHLTGLLTEDAFREKLSEFRENANHEEICGIVYLDIEGFSYVNENFGMEAGNQILREFSRIVLHGKDDIIASRFFSDLFVIYIHSDTKENLRNAVVDIEEQFKNKANLYYPAGHLRLTAGLYIWDIHDVGSDMALENASMAREEAKRIGACPLRIYRDEMREEREQDRLITSEFHQTLRDGRIEMFMQPKFDLYTFEICGSEALARWRMPDGSIRMPSSFINPLEKVGYISELDFHIYEQVLQYMKKWQELGHQLFVISVNFSRKHFREPGVHQLIEALADRYGVPHQYVEIELTETIFSAHRDIVIDELEALRQHKFRVSIDDFGIGYSSLSMLWNLPVDTVKLDRSFLNIENFEERKRFVELLGELIKATNEEIIFEGIETVEQLEFLKDCKFTMGQGYIFSKPIHMDEFESKYIF